jgi:hypothetical protein
MLGVQVKEHRSTTRESLSAVGKHLKYTGHSVSWDNIDVLSREDNWYKRKLREAIDIHQGAPSLIRDAGVELPPIYTGLLSRERLG